MRAGHFQNRTLHSCCLEISHCNPFYFINTKHSNVGTFHFSLNNFQFTLIHASYMSCSHRMCCAALCSLLPLVHLCTTANRRSSSFGNNTLPTCSLLFPNNCLSAFRPGSFIFQHHPIFHILLSYHSIVKVK